MGLFGGELQPPRGGHGQTRDFTDDCTKSAMADAFFHAGKDCLVVASLDINDAVGFQAGLRQRRGKQVWPGDAPKDLAARACCHTAREQRRSCAIDGAVAAARDFMQRAERQSAAREPRIQLGDPERKHRSGAPAPALDLLDARAQCVDGGLRPQDGR